MANFYDAFLKTFSIQHLDVQMILVGAVLFALLYKAMGKWVFGPYLEMIEVREGATVGAKERAKKLRLEAEELNDQYQAQLFEARLEANKQRLGAVDQARKSALAVSTEADTQALKILTDGKGAVARQAEEARTRSISEIDSLAGSLADNVRSRLLN